MQTASIIIWTLFTVFPANNHYATLKCLHIIANYINKMKMKICNTTILHIFVVILVNYINDCVSHMERVNEKGMNTPQH